MLPRKWEVERYFIFPPHLTNASALPDKTRKHENHIFSLKFCVIAFQTSTCCCFISSILLTCNSYSRCCRLSKSGNQLSSALACWGHSSGEMMKLSVLCSSCMHHGVIERQIILSSTTCLITANNCWDSKISNQLNTVHWLLTWGSTKNNSHFWHSDRHHDRLGERWVCGNRR